MNEAAAELLAYYGQLSTERVELAGSVVLHSPLCPLVGANAAYLHALHGAPQAGDWLRLRDTPEVFVWPVAVGSAQQVLSLRVGRYEHRRLSHGFVVEQVSRLHMAQFCAVLATAWGVPEWADFLARFLARALEAHQNFTLLMAYDTRAAVGAVLMLADRAHLWGVTVPEARDGLLDAAAELSGGSVVTSCPAEVSLPLTSVGEISFWLGRELRPIQR